jgi:hypothetical protein
MRVKAKSVLAAAVIGAVSVNIFCAMPVTAAQERPDKQLIDAIVSARGFSEFAVR